MPEELTSIKIDGIDYIEWPETAFSFGNVCRQCAFYGTSCYNRNDFSCHSDARLDGIGIIFKKMEGILNARRIKTIP